MICREHGYCVGISAGANTEVAMRLRDQGLTVATLWPDCSDRYVSMGLCSPSEERCTCLLHPTCASRRENVIGL